MELGVVQDEVGCLRDHRQLPFLHEISDLYTFEKDNVIELTFSRT